MKILLMILLLIPQMARADLVDSRGAFVAKTTIYEMVTSPKTLAVCASADVLTTTYAVSRGLGVEKNPLLAPSVNAHHFFPLLLTKVAWVGLLWWLWEISRLNKTADGVVVVANVVTCGVSVHNMSVILGG